MLESNIQNLILLNLGSDKANKLFRNNTGLGWIGASVRKGDLLIIKNARPLHAGLCVGSSDIIGFHSVIITPDMVGKPVAIFTAIETKAKRGRASKEQLNFIRIIKEAGGIAGIAKSVDEARELIKPHTTNEI